MHLNDPAVREEPPAGRAGRLWPAAGVPRLATDAAGRSSSHAGQGGEAQGQWRSLGGEGSFDDGAERRRLTLAERLLQPHEPGRPAGWSWRGEGRLGDEVSERRRSPGCARWSRRRATSPAGPSRPADQCDRAENVEANTGQERRKSSPTCINIRGLQDALFWRCCPSLVHSEVHRVGRGRPR